MREHTEEYCPKGQGIIEVYPGSLVDVTRLKTSDISSKTITHALSNLCRFGGHCFKFYSVAEHSVMVYEIAKIMGMSKRLQRLAILHDGSEAFLTDLPRPVKMMLPKYKALEDKVQAKIWEWARIRPPSEMEKKAIDWADNIALCFEAAKLLTTGWWDPDVVNQWAGLLHIRTLDHEDAANLMLDTLREAFND